MVEWQEQIEMIGASDLYEIVPTANLDQAHKSHGYRTEEQDKGLKAFGVNHSPKPAQDRVDTCQYHRDQGACPKFNSHKSLKHHCPGVDRY